MVEVLITLFLTAIGILALLSMQPVSWSAAGRSDFLGRAAGLLQSEMERNEIWMMNPLNAVTAGNCDRNIITTGTCTFQTVYASSQAAQQTGDVAYTIVRTVAPFGTNAWTVTVRITWSGNNTGIADSVIVSRQESYRSL